MTTPPIYNPPIPCVYPIPGGMVPGRMLRFQGHVPHGARRFEINLQCGPNMNQCDEIALHINPRFEEMCVVRNHMTNVSWGNEDRSGGIPFSPGQRFEALVLCEQNSIRVAVNGAHFCEFPHRMPYQRITHVNVAGDVTIQLIAFEGTQAPAQPGYAGQGAYGAAYGAQPPSQGAPGYGAPPTTPGYGAPPTGPVYGAPPAAPGYGAPPAAPGYGAPSAVPGYGAPPRGYY